MKRWKKIVLIVGLCLSFSGAILLQIGYKVGGFQSIVDKNKGDFTLQEEKLTSFNNLEADLDRLDIGIKETDAKQAYLSYYNVKNQSPLELTNRKGKLRLTENTKVTSVYKNRIHLLSVSDLILWFQQRFEDQPNPYQVILYLPKGSELTSCSLSVNSGDLKLANLSVDNCSLEAKNGDLSISGNSFKKSEVLISNGDFKAADSQFQNGTFIISNGDCKLSSVTMKNCSLESGNGDVKINETIVTDSKLRLNDGDLKAEKVSFKGINDISNQNGDSKFELASYNVFVTAQSQNGDCSVSSQATADYKSDNRLSLFSVNGDLKVR
ncbi:DUF4097 family beta strand repeat-containing protein [Streptococcus sp. H31]|uniref:DUF4097 family beta strand repeat-containing protein n=1 Tax=Streptococcus huangxiaojuni TaxID=3237239 RepID=UPI0034A1D259